jgi:N-acetylglucosaminylphosphatidylinositol deacetylase
LSKSAYWNRDLQDSPTLWWAEDKVAAQIDKFVKRWAIDTIITFDSGGVSGHINHRAVSSGVRQLITLTRSSSLTAYENVSVNLIRKYSGLLDLPYTFFSCIPRLLFGWRDGRYGLLVSNPGMYLAGRRAFASHTSQYSWDRHIYLLISRYMYYNEISRVE